MNLGETLKKGSSLSDMLYSGEDDEDQQYND